MEPWGLAMALFSLAGMFVLLVAGATSADSSDYEVLLRSAKKPVKRARVQKLKKAA